MITSAHHASRRSCSCTVKNQKDKEGNESRKELTSCFHRYNGTVSHPATDWVVLRLPITATVFPPLSFYAAFLKISIPNCSFIMKYPFPFSCLQLFPTLRSYLTLPSISFSSLCLSCSPVFLVFFVSSLPWCFSACQDMHRRAEWERTRERGERGEREERGRTCGCEQFHCCQMGGVTWGVKVQSQGNTTPQALVLD